MFHALSNEKVQALVSQSEWDELNNDLDPPDNRVDKDFLFLGHDRLIHASRHVVGLESRKYPPHRWLETLKEARVNVVGVEVGQFDWAVFHLELLSQGVGETSECKLACRVV